MISDAALAQLKQYNPCDAIAVRLGVRLRKRGTKLVAHARSAPRTAGARARAARVRSRHTTTVLLVRAAP
jgi:hypothetical protein